MSSALYRLGRWAVSARRWVIAGWLVLLVLLGAVAGLANQGLDRNITIPGTESQAALDSLAKTFPQVSGTSAQLLAVAAEGDQITDATYREAITSTIAELEKLDQVETVVSPFDDDVSGAISDDGDAAVIQVQMTGDLGDISVSTEDALREITSELQESLPAGAEATLQFRGLG